MSQEILTTYETILGDLTNPNLKGPYVDPVGVVMVDRRYSSEAVAELGLSPRTADLNIIGPDVVAVPEGLQAVAKAIVGYRRAIAAQSQQLQDRPVRYVEIRKEPYGSIH